LNSNNVTKTNLINLHRQGRISDEILLLYGISGELPNIEKYSKLSVAEKQSVWSEKLESNLGSDWERQIGRIKKMPAVFRGRSFGKPNWRREGF